MVSVLIPGILERLLDALAELGRVPVLAHDDDEVPFPEVLADAA